AIALFFGGIALAVLLVCALLFALTVRARRRAGQGSYDALRHTAMATIVIGGGWLALCLPQLAPASGMLFGLAMATPGALLLLPAVGCWCELLESTVQDRRET